MVVEPTDWCDEDGDVVFVKVKSQTHILNAASVEGITPRSSRALFPSSSLSSSQQHALMRGRKRRSWFGDGRRRRASDTQASKESAYVIGVQIGYPLSGQLGRDVYELWRTKSKPVVR